MLEAIAESPNPVRRIIITAEPVTDVDVTSADMLAELEHTLTESGIELRFAEMKDPVKDKLKRFELFERFGAANFYPTIGSAVDAYLEEHAVGWKPSRTQATARVPRTRMAMARQASQFDEKSRGLLLKQNLLPCLGVC